MRIRRYMAALLALGLLLGLCPAAVTEDIGDEITSAAVELAVPEEAVALGGGSEAAPATRNTSRSPNTEADSWSMSGTTSTRTVTAC